ncbi:MAG: hypothetical protein HKO59_10295 [Phycisphaerales bacterium]|nr:hypothetical protein [Phycisphaerales bacterium]
MLLSLLVSNGLASAQTELPLYHVTDLAPMVETVFPDVMWPSSDARGLNENGDLVGEASLDFDPATGSKMQAFVYTVEHGVVPLPLLPGWPSNAVTDVSDRDAKGEIIIVGGGVPGPFLDIAIGEAALWRYSTVTGEVLETRGLGLPPGFDESLAVAVDNGGTIAGFSGLTGAFINWKYDVATRVMETFDFPARIKDMNNEGQVIGSRYRGDLFGNYEELVGHPGTGGDYPDWAGDSVTAGWHRINDHGWTVGRAGTGISDGAGHFLVAIIRFAEPFGWTSLNPVSHLSLAGGINDRGDFMTYQGGVYLQDTGELHSINSLLTVEHQQLFSVYRSFEINNNRQIAAIQAHAMLLTPLGEMIIPGDVNGDVQVDLDDHCAWVADPFDLDGDGDVDAADEQWLIDRLAVFGFLVEDCNGNGLGDHCEILDGLSADCDGNDVPDECQPDCSGDGIPDACEDDCNDNGVPDPCDIAAGTSQDCNDNGIPDECDAGGLTQATVVYDPPLPMFTDSTLVVDTVVLDAGTIEDVDLTLNVRYRLGDFTILLSHGDTTITIMDRPGYPEHLGGFVNFGYDAIVDDEGTGPYLEEAGDECCDFEWLESPPSYRPDNPLAAFDGMSSAGTWTLTLITTDWPSPGDGLLGWGLDITRASIPVGSCCEGDLDGSGDVGFPDLLTVLSAWGPCAGCPADLDGSGDVGFTDLLTIMSAWGVCP